MTRERRLPPLSREGVGEGFDKRVSRGENKIEVKTDVLLEAKTKKYHLRYWDSLTWAAKNNRKKETESEKILWNKLLRKKQLGYKFTRQKPIGRFIVDFYCSELSLVIEIDGGSHDQKKGRDVLRDRFLSCCGIKTLRFTDRQVMGDINRVEDKIKQFVASSPVKGRIKEGFENEERKCQAGED